VRIGSLGRFCCLLTAFLPLFSLPAFARRVATQISSAYGQFNDPSQWRLSGPTTITLNGVQITTETVCPPSTLSTTTVPPVCPADYLFLYEIPSGPNNLVLTFSGLSGFAFNASNSFPNPKFGVFLCPPPAIPPVPPPAGLLCTQNLSDIDSLNISFDAWSGNLVVTISEMPPSADTLTFFIDESPPIASTQQVVPWPAPVLSIGGAILSPSALAFGSQEVGTTSAPQTVTLFNPLDFTSNTANLTVGAASTSANFAVSGTCAPLAPGSSCPYQISFSPTTVNGSPGIPTTGMFSVSDNTPPAEEILNLSGAPNLPGVTISPSSMTFGSQVVGTTSASQTFTIANSSANSASLTIASLTIAPDPVIGTPDFAFPQPQDGCTGVTIPPGGSCQAAITFSPPSIGGSLSSTLTISDSTGGTHIIALSGTAQIAQTAIASFSSLTFPNQAVGTASTPQTITVTNTSATSLTIVAVNATAEFTISSDNCTAASPIAAGTTCTESIEFNPTVSGTLTGTLTIADDAVDGTLVIPLTGIATAPAANLSATSVAFGSELVGSTSGSQTVTISNGGNAPLTFSTVTITGTNVGDFSIQSSSTCSAAATLAAGSSCAVNLTFTPQSGGPRSAILSIADNAPGGSQTVTLSGTAMDFGVSPSPGSVTITQGDSGTFTITVTSIGEFTGTVAMTCSGAPSEATCTSSQQSVSVGSSGTAQATFTVTTTAPSAVSKTWPSDFERPYLFHATSALVCCLLLLPFTALRVRKNGLIPILAVMLISATCMSCGGSSSSTGSAQQTNPGTPTGKSTLTISAASGGLTHTTTVTLTVN
jgi:hypothetical protein